MSPKNKSFDVVVIGAGIAGLSVAAELSKTLSVAVLERETQPGYHATGRSAAYFSPAYGNATVRGLSEASGGFYKSPPRGFSDVPLLHPREALHIAPAGHEHGLQSAIESISSLSEISLVEAMATVPALNPKYVEAAALETGGGDLDVNAILQGHLRRLRNNGGSVLTAHEVGVIKKADGHFSIDSSAQCLNAAVVVNAAGAWADTVAGLAGVPPIGLIPKRRSAFLVPAPEKINSSDWPLVINQAHPLYFKPDAGALLVSPMDETPSAPCDAAPEELDIAEAAERFEASTTMRIKRITHRWAGLRTFAPDETFVVGFEPNLEGFFWLAGQGGYGVQAAPALASLAAGQIIGALGQPPRANESERPAKGLNSDLEKNYADAVSPARFRN